jgi:hypothetical protein
MHSTHVRGLEYSPMHHSLYTHFILICDQIHAPATLPSYVHMHFMNGPSKPDMSVALPRTERFRFFLMIHSAPWRACLQFVVISSQAPFTLSSFAATEESKRWRAY